jgi:voltage-dependent potassium channel beta subunit
MKYRRLGRYGIQVSEVALGGWLTQGRTLDDAATAAIIHRALDLGVNFFDTADAYAKGESERALGVAIKGLRRQDLVIATKCFWPFTENVNDQGLSRKHIVESVNASLSRLAIEYIDIFQFHRYDVNTPLDETIRAIDDLIRQGKVLYWGVSEWKASQIADACHIARALNANPPVSNQPQYNLLERCIEDEVMPICSREGLGLVVWSPMAQGVLTGKYKPGAPIPKGTRGSDEQARRFMERFLTDDTLQRVESLEKLAADAGVTMAQFALAWCLRRQEVSSVIVGATKVDQLEENVGASGLQINPALFAQAEELLSS